MKDVADQPQPLEATSAYPRTSYAAFALGVLMVAAVVSLLDRQILALMVGPLKASLKITDTQVALLQGLAFASFYAVLGLPLGFLVDRFNRRNLIIVGILAWSLMTILCGLSNSFTQLFLARMGVGIGEAVLHPAAYSLISDIFPLRTRGRAYSLFSGAATIGIALSMLLGGLLLAAVGRSPTVALPVLGLLPTWKAVFVMVGLPGVVLAALLLGLREPVRRERSIVTAAGGRRPALTPFLAQNWRALLIVLAPNALINLTGYGVIAWMAAGFVRTYHLSLAQAGLTCGLIMPMAAPAGAAIGGVLGDRWTVRQVPGGKALLPVLTGVLGAVAFSAWWLSHSYVVAVICGMAAFSLQVATTSVAPAALNELVPNDLRGRMSAIFLLVTGIVGIGLGPYSVAAVTDHLFHDEAAVGFAMVAVAVPALLLAAAISWSGRQLYSRAVQQRRAELSDT